MTPYRTFRAAAVLLALSLAAAIPARAQGPFPLTLRQLNRCVDMPFEAHFGSYYTGSAECEHEVEVCGGDPLDHGDVRVFPAGRMHVTVAAANPWNMYEVYWHPLSGDPTDPTVTIMVGTS